MYFDENGVKEKLILSPQHKKENKELSKTPTGVGELNLKMLGVSLILMQLIY